MRGGFVRAVTLPAGDHFCSYSAEFPSAAWVEMEARLPPGFLDDNFSQSVQCNLISGAEEKRGGMRKEQAFLAATFT